MDGAQWIEQVLTPALRRGTPSRPVLHAQVQALRDCQVLDADKASEAVRRIETDRPVIEPAGASAPPPTSRLLRVLAPALPLADIDGVTYVLTSVELWDHLIEVFVAGVPSAYTASRERDAEAALQRWARLRRADPDRAGPPPDAMGSHHLGVLVSIGDDVGTSYRRRQASLGGTGTPWRLHLTSTPGVPATAKRLTVQVNDDDGRPVQRHEIRLDT